MQAATGPWVLAPMLPDDPKRLCLVELEHMRTRVITYYAMRYLRGNWQFQDRLRLSGEQRVVRWALILESAPAAVPL